MTRLSILGGQYTPMVVAHGVLMQVGEDQLVSRCRAGDLDAFAQVYDRYERQVYRYALHILGHRDDADDIKQETFLKAYQAIGSFRSESSLQTWLLRICGNLCRDKIKSWDRRNVTYDSTLRDDELGGSDEEQGPQAVVERKMMTEIIFKALRGMPPAQRELIVLHEVEDLSYEQIAAVLGCSRTSIKLRLFRARRSLKDRVASLMGQG
jgi:RNA polymerase sigma-70 factor (ECF subfamily)